MLYSRMFFGKPSPFLPMRSAIFSLALVSTCTARTKRGRVLSSCLTFRALDLSIFKPPALTSGESTHPRNLIRNSRRINTSNSLNLKLRRINTYVNGGRGWSAAALLLNRLLVSLTACASLSYGRPQKSGCAPA
jgi:hypothetical protein